MPLKRSCEIDGNKISYYREGKGDTVLLLHGITTYSFIWRKIIPLLNKKYDVIAVDLLGCGDSDKPLDVDYSIKSQAAIIAAFIKKLKLEKLHLISHDIGGGIAQILAVKYTNLFIDVTVINSVAYDFWPVQPIIAMRTPIIRQLAMATLDLGAFKLIVKRGLYNKNVMNDELMDYFWAPMKTRIGRKAFLHLAECLNNRQLIEIEDELKVLPIPFLIIRGDADVYLSSEICQKLHENIASSKLVRIAHAGHFMMEEVPEEIVNYVEQFFNGQLDV